MAMPALPARAADERDGTRVPSAATRKRMMASNAAVPAQGVLREGLRRRRNAMLSGADDVEDSSDPENSLVTPARGAGNKRHAAVEAETPASATESAAKRQKTTAASSSSWADITSPKRQELSDA